MQENYKILELPDGAPLEDVEEAYKILKKKYSEERFLEGEAGNIAAKKLTMVENAYRELKAELEGKNTETNSYSFEEVENFLKNGDYNSAQNKLDEYSQRNAEWHYLQSVIFYKKNWTNESKKQLEIALSMDPSNQKYSEAYSKLRQKMDFNERQFHSGNANFNNTAQNGNRQMGGEGLGGCLEFCATWCCMNMLLNLCCSCR